MMFSSATPLILDYLVISWDPLWNNTSRKLLHLRPILKKRMKPTVAFCRCVLLTVYLGRFSSFSRFSRTGSQRGCRDVATGRRSGAQLRALEKGEAAPHTVDTVLLRLEALAPAKRPRYCGYCGYGDEDSLSVLRLRLTLMCDIL